VVQRRHAVEEVGPVVEGIWGKLSHVGGWSAGLTDVRSTIRRHVNNSLMCVNHSTLVGEGDEWSRSWCGMTTCCWGCCRESVLFAAAAAAALALRLTHGREGDCPTKDAICWRIEFDRILEKLPDTRRSSHQARLFYSPRRRTTLLYKPRPQTTCLYRQKPAYANLIPRLSIDKHVCRGRGPGDAQHRHCRCAQSRC
jgi:hypothetical protein